jgi:hypothetical protein
VSNNTEVFPGTTDRIILLSGSLNSVLTAARMVVAELFKETPKENPEPTFAEVRVVNVLLMLLRRREFISKYRFDSWNKLLCAIDRNNKIDRFVSDYNGRYHCCSSCCVRTHYRQRRRKNQSSQRTNAIEDHVAIQGESCSWTEREDRHHQWQLVECTNGEAWNFFLQ